MIYIYNPKYTAISLSKVYLIQSLELLDERNVDNYKLGYSSFKIITYGDAITAGNADHYNVYIDTASLSSGRVNYLGFTDIQGNLTGLYNLESPINLSEYQIKQVIIKIEWSENEYGPVIRVNLKGLSYKTHLTRTSTVHKADLHEKYSTINDINRIVKRPNITVSDLMDFKENEDSIIRYAGSYFRGGSTEGGSIGKYFEPLYIEGVPLEIDGEISFYEDDNLGLFMLAVVGDSVYRYGVSNGGAMKIITPGAFVGKFNNQGTIKLCGDVVYTSTTVHFVKNNETFNCTNLRIVRDDINGTVYTVTKNGNIASDELNRLLLRTNRSTNVANITGCSDLYSIIETEGGGSVSCLGKRTEFRYKVSKVIPIRQRAFLILYENNYADLIEVTTDDNGEFISTRTEFGFPYGSGIYAKYVEKIARNRTTTPLTFNKDSVIGAFKGQVLCRSGNTIYAL